MKYDLSKAVLLLDENIAKKNIDLMVKKAETNNLRFRPHFKTHQSAEIGQWFHQSGVNAITVSSVTMAEYFAAAGWKDICIAFPLNPLEIETINSLAEKVKLIVLVSDFSIQDFIMQKLSPKVTLDMEINAGQNRSGFLKEDTKELTALVRKLSRKFPIRGLLSHFGHTYQATSKNAVCSIYEKSIQEMLSIKTALTAMLPDCEISVGDTPSAMLLDSFPGINELRPGNFIFFDNCQWDIGSCGFSDIACVLAAPLVAVYEKRQELIVYGGAVHLSKEASPSGHYGRVLTLNDTLQWCNNVPSAYVRAVSQEHGIIAVEKRQDFDTLKHSKRIGIVPVHSCLCADLMKAYYCHGRIISMLS